MRRPAVLFLAWAACIAAAPAWAANYGRFLSPDQAFRLSAVGHPGRVVLAWQIADGYYLYKDRFKVTAAAGAIGSVGFPPGESKDDPNFGRVVVYRRQVSLDVPVTRRSADGTVTLVVTYQGCADAGLCYTPITKRLRVSVPAGSAPAAAASARPATPANAGGGVARSDQDRLAGLIEHSSPGWFVLVFFGLGVLLAFTPCVLPMIPVLAGVIGGEAGALSTRRGFFLSLIYVLAMAVVYTAAGVAAGFFGSGLQAYFQAPWVVALFAAVFVGLAASLLGFYELRLPAAAVERLTRLSGRQRGGTWLGAAVMGMLSALIVSPCVAAPLAGALVVIGQAGEPVRGGLALFALALGMGAPLIVFGTVAGRLLPRAGAWMQTLERLLGVALLAFAVWLLGRIVPPAATLVLWGLVGILASVLIGAFDRLDPAAGSGARLGKAVGLAAFAYAVVLMIGGAAGAGNPLAPLAGLAGRAQAPGQAGLAYRPVASVTNLRAAVAQASAAGLPVMLEVSADWCTACKEMDNTTLRAPEVVAGLRRMQLLRADVTHNTPADRALLEHYHLFGPPAYLFFDRHGNRLSEDTVIGYLAATPFLHHVRHALDAGRPPPAGVRPSG